MAAIHEVIQTTLNAAGVTDSSATARLVIEALRREGYEIERRRR